jgi:hypothetical protein
MRISLLAAAYTILFWMMAFAVPQQASAAGKFAGEWKGKIICGEATEFLTEATTPPVDNGTGLTVAISNNGRVSKFMWDGGEDQKIVVDGAIKDTGKFSSIIKYVTDDGYDDTMTVTGEYKNQPLTLKWNWLSIDSVRPSKYPCQASLTRDNNAQLVQAWETENKSRRQDVASTVLLKPVAVKIVAPSAWAGTTRKIKSGEYSLTIKFSADGRRYHANIYFVTRSQVEISGNVKSSGEIESRTFTLIMREPDFRLSGNVSKLILDSESQVGDFDREAVFEIDDFKPKSIMTTDKGGNSIPPEIKSPEKEAPILASAPAPLETTRILEVVQDRNFDLRDKSKNPLARDNYFVLDEDQSYGIIELDFENTAPLQENPEEVVLVLKVSDAKNSDSRDGFVVLLNDQEIGINQAAIQGELLEVPLRATSISWNRPFTLTLRSRGIDATKLLSKNSGYSAKLKLRFPGAKKLLLASSASQSERAGATYGSPPVWANTTWHSNHNRFFLTIKYSADGKSYRATVDTLRDIAKCSGKVDLLGKIEPVICEFERWQPRRISGTVFNIKLQNNGSSGGAIFKIAELEGKMNAILANNVDPAIAQQQTDKDRETAAAERNRRLVEAERQRQKAEAQRLAELERQRQEQEAQRLAELERQRQVQEAQRLAELERQRQVQEAQRLAELERQRQVQEAQRLAELERQRQEQEAQRLVELERQRQEQEAQRLAELERQRQEQEALRLAELERKREAADAQKRQAAQQAAAAIGGSGKLQQQLAVLKQLRTNSLIDEQEFKSQKKSLLAKFLGLKTAPSVKPSTPENIIQANVAKFSDVDFGKYYALVIGSNNYEHLPKLETAKKDAEDIAETLRTSYGFEVNLLTDATRDQILDAFDGYRAKLKEQDNLLIYYAGHGWLDEEADRGYWLPVDATANKRRDWISSADVTDTLRALDAKHVLVMADSCFSGTLVRGVKVRQEMPDYIRKMANKRARLVITSGGLEPVVDSAGGEHSPFASVFLNLLKSNEGVMDGTQMFSKMRRPVMLSADQTPEYSDVRKAGHEGGDFLFVRRR